MTLDEPELIRKAQAGDLEAFARLVAMHQKSVRACVAVRVTTPHDAEDIAQEVFLIAHRKLAGLDASQPLGPWLRTVAFFLLKNHLRKIQRSPVSAVSAQAFIPAPGPDPGVPCTSTKIRA